MGGGVLFVSVVLYSFIKLKMGLDENWINWIVMYLMLVIGGDGMLCLRGIFYIVKDNYYIVNFINVYVYEYVMCEKMIMYEN